jgi:hypothetical protein
MYTLLSYTEIIELRKLYLFTFTGIGFFLTVHYNVMTEFALNRWRPRIVAVPAWAFGAGLFALAAWLLKDWKNLHLVTAAIGVPFLFTYLYVKYRKFFYTF